MRPELEIRVARDGTHFVGVGTRDGGTLLGTGRNREQAIVAAALTLYRLARELPTVGLTPDQIRELEAAPVDVTAPVPPGE